MTTNNETDGSDVPTSDKYVRAGGREHGAAGDDMAAVGMESATPGPMGAPGGASGNGPAANGSLGSGTYNDRGDVTGPDSPAGANAGASGGEGQGDDLANRLGGDSNRGTGMSGAGAVTGNMGAASSEASGARDRDAAGTPSAGDPGGMGGVRAQGGTGTGRPPGGVSPLSE